MAHPPRPSAQAPFVVESRRQNHTPASAASFQTARTDLQGPGSRSASRSSLGPLPTSQEANPIINPIHTLSLRKDGVPPEQVHIIKVKGDQVHLASGPIDDSLLHKVGSSLARVVPSSATQPIMVEPHFGTLPPSPPASIEEEKEFRFPSTQRTARSKPEASYQPDTGLPRPFVPEKLHRASTDTKISLSTITTSPGRTPRLSNHSDRSDDSGVAQSQEDTPNTETSSTFPGPSSNTAVTQSPDGHLQPPQLARPTRRNTTGSAPRPANVSLHNQHGYGSQPFVYEEDDVDVVLASDIQQQADQIRRERNSKRVKAQQEAEAVLTRTQSMSRGARAGARALEDGAQVLVGNLIGEDHVNYVLMYNMLTGIRIAVSTFGTGISFGF